MKKFLLLMLIVVSAFTSPVLAQDTVVNNGDGKVVIIDKRPKVVYQNNTSLSSDIQILKEMNNAWSKLSYDQKVLETKYSVFEAKMNTAAELDKLYQNMIKSNNNNNLYILLALGIVAVGLYWIYISNNKSCDCGCNYKQPQAPVINHFNVAGGSAVIDGSENLSNFQPENHYHRHCLPPMIQERSTATKTEKASEVLT